MKKSPSKKSLFLLSLLAALVSAVPAQVPVTEAIQAKYALTKASADRRDIVTAGAVIVLKKDGLVMFPTDAPVRASLNYKDGRIQATTQTKIAAASIFGQPPSVANRKFVAGEKFWLIDVQAQQDGVQLQLLSDPFSDVRYMAYLKFPYGKGSTPSSDQMMAVISQVMDVDGPVQTERPAPQTPPVPTPKPTKLEEIAPPPPPTDLPVAAIGIGSTKDEVVAAWGQPQRSVNASATKEIAIYSDRKSKITYTNNKVTKMDAIE